VRACVRASDSAGRPPVCKPAAARLRFRGRPRRGAIIAASRRSLPAPSVGRSPARNGRRSTTEPPPPPTLRVFATIMRGEARAVTAVVAVCGGPAPHSAVHAAQCSMLFCAHPPAQHFSAAQRASEISVKCSYVINSAQQRGGTAFYFWKCLTAFVLMGWFVLMAVPRAQNCTKLEVRDKPKIIFLS